MSATGQQRQRRAETAAYCVAVCSSKGQLAALIERLRLAECEPAAEAVADKLASYLDYNLARAVADEIAGGAMPEPPEPEVEELPKLPLGEKED